jgi:Ser/Thr protein kinase RdoA (MazF antagonist)
VAGREEFQQERLDRAAAQVRARYPAASGAGPLVTLGNRGGFSRARLWRGEGAAGAFCLRAWPAHTTADRVRGLHRIMQHARGQDLDFVPAVFASGNGDTVVETAGGVWELTQWLTGRADFAEHPRAARLEAACEALARLHRAWEAFTTPAEPCPAVRRRLQVLADWQDLLASGWRPRPSADPCLDPVGPLAERAWRGLPTWLQTVSRSLGPWVDFRSPVQPCLCDLWHDHLLYEGDRLVGLVDYGAVKADLVAVDLSRMLGSLVGDDLQGWELGLRSYRRVRDLDGNQERLARVLDRTGVILGITNWLRWLYHENRPYEDLTTIARRMEHLLRRIETWTF